MNKSKIISKVKMLDEEKVAVSLRLPVSLKKELQTYCDKEKISMNSLIIESMYSFINDECGSEIEQLESKLKSARRIIEYFKDMITLSEDEIENWSRTYGLPESEMSKREDFLKERLKMNLEIANFLNKE